MPTAKVVAINSGTHRFRVRARRDELVMSHLSLVEGIARGVAASLPPSFDLDDLIATGNLALIHAATRYRPGMHGGAPFSAYARLVVRGAIIESCRRKRYTENTRPGLEQIRQNSSDTESMENAGDSDALNRAAVAPTVEEAIDRARTRRRVSAAISWLPVAAQRVLREYYSADEPTLKQVGEVLEMSPRDARAVHAESITALRARLKAA